MALPSAAEHVGGVAELWHLVAEAGEGKRRHVTVGRPTFGEVVWHMEPLHPVIGTHGP